MRSLVTLACVSLLSGCALFPQNRAELEAGGKSKSYCYAEPTQTITDRVRTHLTRCFRSFASATAVPVGPGVFVPVQTTFYWAVDEEQTQSGTWFGARGRYGYVLSSELSGSESGCSTTMRVHLALQTWSDQFEELDKVARNQSAECPPPTRP